MKASKMIKRIIIAAAIAVFFAAALPFVPAEADTSSLLSILPSDQSGALTATADVFTGRNTRGPFVLTWKPISEHSDKVYVNGRMMLRGQDYEVDHENSIIAFTNPVSAGSSIRVEYGYDSKNAAKNSTASGMPVSLNLVKNGSSGLELMALTKNSSNSSDSSLSLSLLGLKGDTKLGNTELNSMFLMSSGEGDGSGNFLDKSAVRVGGKTGSGNFSLNTSFLMVGRDYQGADKYKYNRGTEALDIGATYKPMSTLSLTSSMNRTDTDTGDSAGKTVSTSTNSLVFDPSASTRLSLARTEVNTDAAVGSDNTVVTEKMEISHSVGTKLSARASHEAVRCTADDSDTCVTTDRVSLRADPFKGFTLSSDLMQTESSTTGTGTGIAVNVAAAPAGWVTVKAGINQNESDLSGRAVGESISLAAKPGRSVNLDLQLDRSNSDSLGEAITKAVSVSAAPVRNTSIQLKLSEMESDLSGTGQSGAVSVKSAISNSISLTGSVSQTKTEDSIKFTRGAGLELRLSQNGLLTTSFSLEDYAFGGLQQTAIYRLGYTHQVGSRMNLYLTGRMTAYSQDQVVLADRNEYQAEAKLGLRF